MTPQRIQRKRTKGWRMPEGAVYVGRPTMWGNPFFASVMGAERAVEYFRQWAEGQGDYVRMARRELAGKDLACWCALDAPCHADVLLEIANQRVLHCFFDFDDGYYLDDDTRVPGHTCMLEDNHDGPHEPTSDDEIGVSFADGGGVNG